MTEMPDDDPRIDELFALAPEEFTATRNALVRQLRADGLRELATQVAALRRPTAAAWAVNQTVRAHADEFEELLAAGAAVRTAQRRALSGVPGGMRDATRRRREQIERLSDRATRILDEHGVASSAQRGDIVATFDAASADDAAAARVREARLSQALPVSSDFDALEGLTVLANVEPAVGTPDAAPSNAGDVGSAAAEPTDDEAAADAARQEAALARRHAIRAVSDARRRLADARQEADRAAAEAERAAARATAADQTATAAEDKARRLRRDADERADRAATARTRAVEAEQSARRSADELEAAQQELDALN
ncbi:MAG TPA: hypothetical protein VFZ70_18530 [Euzebyales bacterium]